MAKKTIHPEHRSTTDSTDEATHQKAENQNNNILTLTNKALNLLHLTEDTISELAQVRSLAKLSNSRVTSVRKELRELSKVLSQYCRN